MSVGNEQEMTTVNKVLKQRTVRFWREWMKPLIVVIVVCCAFRSAVADWNDVPTGSMTPTLLVGDRILVNKLAYDLKVPFTTWHLLEWGDPERGDIVVCFSPADGNRLVKRVIATPGDTVELRGNRLIVNGAPSTYAPLADDIAATVKESSPRDHVFASETLGKVTHAVMGTPALIAKRDYGPVTIPDGMYFMMGDNRDESFDSRMFGFVPRDQIVGRTSRLVFSLDYDRYYLPRWSRTLQSVN